MVAQNLVDTVLALPPAERLQLIRLAWESLADQPDALEIDEELKQELERRYQDYLANPDEGEPWEEVRASIQAHIHR